jgi:hypothetical protein
MTDMEWTVLERFELVLEVSGDNNSPAGSDKHEVSTYGATGDVRRIHANPVRRYPGVRDVHDSVGADPR